MEDIVLPHLESLVLAFNDGACIRVFLRTLVLPAVRSISFRPRLTSTGIRQALQVETRDLIQIILRSNRMPQLQQLYLGATGSLIEAGPILKLLPGLEEVAIRHGFLDEDAMEVVATGKLGRCLIKIFLTGPHDGQKLVKMIRQRRGESQKDNSDVAGISRGSFGCLPVEDPVRKKLVRAITLWEDINLEFNAVNPELVV
ncbi:hypothetical protein AX15_005471 [Amanita polypyramis BW_CC]|nr:hypothetical protein AX15_005471 [Amanita polypyramis BW_CC]